jgi:tetratricopeptide (TPR) repeat protein
MTSISTITLFAFCMVAMAQNGGGDSPTSASCIQLKDATITQTVRGHFAEAETLVSAATVSGACTGQVLGSMASTMAVLGNIAEARRLAEQSIRILEKFYPQDDVVFLRPLQTLVSLRLEWGEFARAREALRRLETIGVRRPADSAIIHATKGGLLHAEGQRSEAAAEYRAALLELDEAGRSESEDAATILHSLATVYLGEQRLEEARQVLDRALAIHNRAKDSVPRDRMIFLDLRAILHARLGEWQQAERDLRDALSAREDRQPVVDRALYRYTLANYAIVLRKNHHRREAQSIEARLAALPVDHTTADVVDFSDLLVKGKGAKKGIR